MAQTSRNNNLAPDSSQDDSLLEIDEIDKNNADGELKDNNI